METNNSSDDILTLEILLSAVHNLPVISNLGFASPKIIVLNVPEGNRQEAMRIFQSKTTAVIDETMNLRRIQECFTYPGYSYLLYTFTGSKRSLDVLNDLYSIVKAGYSNDYRISSTVVVITDQPFFFDEENRFFLASIETDLRDISVPKEKVIPQDKYVVLAFDQIKKIVTNDLELENAFLYAAACFLYPMMDHNEILLGNYLDVADRMIEKDENSHDMQGLAEMFQDKIWSWVRVNCFQEMYPLPLLGREEQESLNWSMYYSVKDDQTEYVFMSDELFKSILGDITQVTGIDAVKNALKEEGILAPDNATTYTVKMRFQDKDSLTNKSRRMLRFRNNKLVNADGMNLVDRCTLNSYCKEKKFT